MLSSRAFPRAVTPHDLPSAQLRLLSPRSRIHPIGQLMLLALRTLRRSLARLACSGRASAFAERQELVRTSSWYDFGRHPGFCPGLQPCSIR